MKIPRYAAGVAGSEDGILIAPCGRVAGLLPAIESVGPAIDQVRTLGDLDIGDHQAIELHAARDASIQLDHRRANCRQLAADDIAVGESERGEMFAERVDLLRGQTHFEHLREGKRRRFLGRCSLPDELLWGERDEATRAGRTVGQFQFIRMRDGEADDERKNPSWNEWRRAHHFS